jgi:uncharacterized repeat protein (TIGR03803 family)
VVLGTNGSLYGTTTLGGHFSAGCAAGCGIVFKAQPAGTGTFTKIYSFCTVSGCPDGSNPDGSLVQGTDGDLYGTTSHGGSNGGGTIFKITPAGTLTTLYAFCSLSSCTDGLSPKAGLVQGTDGNFYGTTYEGGAGTDCASEGGCGTVFKITPAGALTTLYSFCSQSSCNDGAFPTDALIQANDGNFYGTTLGGGTGASGTVFKITSSGTLTTLYSFCSQSNCTDGAFPEAGLVQATDGNFYGATSAGGSVAYCPFSYDAGCGTLFQITSAGTLTTLYSFCSQSNCPDGYFPSGGLAQATNGDLYGTTKYGPQTVSACGVWSVGASGDVGCGTIFSLSMGLGPFVETVPTSGSVGTSVTILGNSLSGTTAVSFNGTTASFTVVSGTEITTTVPTGATTGTVAVTTSSGTLNSNVAFQVTP